MPDQMASSDSDIAARTWTFQTRDTPTGNALYRTLWEYRNEAAILGYIQAESLIPRKRIAVNMIHKRHNDPDYYALSKNSILLELGERRRVTPRSSSGATPMVPSLNMLYRLELTTAVENPRGSIFTADTASPILFTHGEEQDGAVDALSALYRTRFQEPYGS